MANPVDSFTERQYITAHMPTTPVPPAFRHTRPSAKPTRPAFPDTLTDDEAAEVQQWLRDRTPTTLPNATAKTVEFDTYKKAMNAWRFANSTARVTQYRIAYADGIIYNKPTTASSANPAGTGLNPPGGSVYPRNDP